MIAQHLTHVKSFMPLTSAQFFFSFDFDRKECFDVGGSFKCFLFIIMVSFYLYIFAIFGMTVIIWFLLVDIFIEFDAKDLIIKRKSLVFV